MVEYFKQIHFENPGWFWLLLSIPLLSLWYYLKYHQQTASVKISQLNGFKINQGILPKLRPLLFVLKMLGLALLITAMARPRTFELTSQVQAKEGIDIMMAMDVSGSMLARDLKPDRLQALKKVASEFVAERPNDRMGIVIYAGESYTKTPITSDKNILMNAIQSIEYDRTIKDGTAIGMGLATAVSRIKDSPAESKIIILLTDGDNNAGEIDPHTAIQLARKYKIKVYTIGIGTNGMAMSPVGILPNGQLHFERIPVVIDEELMKEVAQKTGGKYFRATDETTLKNIYEEINKLETSEIEEEVFRTYTEKYRPFILLAGILFLMEYLLKNTIFRSFV